MYYSIPKELAAFPMGTTFNLSLSALDIEYLCNSYKTKPESVPTTGNVLRNFPNQKLLSDAECCYNDAYFHHNMHYIQRDWIKYGIVK